MIADRVVDTHTGQIIMGTAPNGDVYSTSGTGRQRYSPTDKALYVEIKVGGIWYIQTTTLDSSLSAAGLSVSPVQDIN